MLYFSSCFSQATDIVFRFTEEGERVRVSQRTGRIIPIPDEAIDKTKQTYQGMATTELVVRVNFVIFATSSPLPFFCKKKLRFLHL